MNLEAVIGLEIHIQLLTESKIFCSCSTQFGGSANSQICPVCMGLPGALPVLNQQTVVYAIRLALATGCRIRPRSVFARKNYFYPDLPKGYQISQFDQPFCEAGYLAFEMESGERRVRIRRIHLEEDAGKSIHAESFVSAGESLVDLNRCGVPLLELVTEPDLRTPAEAAALLVTLRQLVRYLGICDGNMEEGSLRCDANVSLRPAGSTTLGVKTELKNLNSFRHVERALTAEIQRQRQVLESGQPVKQQTLLWDADRQVVEPMRSKEESHDYRYFPEPDLPPLSVAPSQIETVRASMPELPAVRKQRYQQEWHLPEYDARVLTEDPEVAAYFEAVCSATADKKAASNWVMGDVLRAVRERGEPVGRLRVTPQHLAKLLNLVAEGAVNLTTAKKLFNATLETGEDPGVAAEGLLQVNDETALAPIIDKILAEHGEEVAAFREGKEKVFGFFVGRVMAATGGRANAGLVQAMLRRSLTAGK